MKKAYWQTCVLTILISLPAVATTIVMPTDEQLVTKSPLIVEGTVVRSNPIERNGAIWTETILAVDTALKGNASGEIVIREVGGQIDEHITKVYGTPEYAAGEHVLAFLIPSPRGDYQTTDLFVGKFGDERTSSGERLWTRHDESADVAMLDGSLQPMAPKNVQRRAAEFETFIRERVAGRKTAASYSIENPVLERDLRPGGLTRTSNFTLLAEPTVYRWFAFDNGGSANWSSYGTQPGYSGGGASEIQSAMAAWNDYASAKIRYVYAGAGGGSPAGLSRANGVNEILYNDPLGEIAGSYNPSTGGIVGQGGFNNTTSGGTWTSPFAADPAHPVASYRASNIVEGNLVIQDNVSPSSGISSALLAEIVAHEFGHTLGFGHSADSTALMYATVTGRGASLRTDDQNAARWLYPNGTQTSPTPAVPSAPANLFGSTNSSQIFLQWSDSATNEAGDYVYLAAGSGAFSRVATTGAGATSATLSGLAAGTYRVYVTAYNVAGESAASNTITVAIASAPSTPAPTAAFTVSSLSGTAGQTTFTFTDQSTGTITSRSWYFGDGGSSSAVSPTHVYTTSGQYTAILTVGNSTGSTQTSRVITVTAPLPATPSVSAVFDYAPGSPRAGDAVSFFDRSSGVPNKWAWSFGDGGTSSSQNPTHAFATAGSYTVTMTATNSGGASSQTSRNVIIANVIGTYRSLVSAAAQTNGVGGSVWRTELTLFNGGSEGASLQLTFIPSAGGALQTRSSFLGAQQTVTYTNALLDVFGLSSGGGAIAIEATSASSTPSLKVSSRTFTSGSSGTYGQAVPSVTSDGLQATSLLTGIEQDADYRTNIGLVNRSASPLTATLALFADNGTYLGATNVSVGANNFSQTSILTYFPGLSSGAWSRLSLSATTQSANALSVYASVIDNRTQDPVFIQGVPSNAGGTEMTIPVVGRAPGINGTFWRSDVTLFNTTAATMTVSARFLPSGSDNRFAPAHAFTLAPGQAYVARDIVSTFGLSSGSGALQLTWNGAAPVVTSRTYTSVDGGGTFGQSIDPITTAGYDSVVPGLRSDASFRSNVGFVNTGDTTLSVGVALLSASGQQLGTATLQLPPRSQSQTSVAAMFPNVNAATLGSCTLRAHTGDAPALFAYASIVDNASGDPVFFAGQ
jgi:PKD repeat protein